MSAITSELTNRDIAVFAWLVVFAIFVLVKRDTRRAVGNLLRVLFTAKISLVLLGLMVYVAVLVFGGYRLGAWQPWMLKDTVYWFGGTALVSFFTVNQVSTEAHFFRKTVLGNVRFAVVLDFAINLYVFGLVVELLLVPFVTLLAMLLVVAGTKPEFRATKTLLQWLSVLVGFVILGHAVTTVVANPRGLANLHTVQGLLLPLALTLLILPFLYVLALYMTYDSLYTQLKIFSRNKRLIKFAMWQVVKTCRWRLSRVKRFSSSDYLLDVRAAESEAEVLDAMKAFAAGTLPA